MPFKKKIIHLIYVTGFDKGETFVKFFTVLSLRM